VRASMSGHADRGQTHFLSESPLLTVLPRTALSDARCTGNRDHLVYILLAGW
jgi:hypothetical protein